MTAWARLTWQAPEPATLAAALAERLGVRLREGGMAPGAWTVQLRGALLEVRPWQAESPGEVPGRDGRLVLEPVPGGEEPPSIDDAGGGDRAGGDGLVLAGVGWATVELDRAEEELGPWLGAPLAGGATDPHLGAFARIRAGGGLPGEAVVLLEPNTEGRLAASLAREGEGPGALYLRPVAGLAAWATAARRRGVVLSSAADGPLGRERLVLGGARTGPHLLLVETRPPAATMTGDGTGTIAP